MATSLAAQLARVAAQSKNTLNVKAQRSAHSKSLLFDPRIAAGQTYQSIYSICVEGFEELCHLDSRFSEYGSTLFSSASLDEDRTQMTTAENAKLDQIIDSFLHLVGGRLRLMPAIKTLEWLIRRFRIHEFNTSSLLTTFLPYHTIPAFVTLMSILPAQLPQEFRFLYPYIKSLTSPPRAAIIQNTVARSELLTTISTYTLESCRRRTEYPSLISFWGGIMVQTVNALIDKNRSGRQSVQMANDQALASQILPILSECLMIRDVPGIQIATYMVVTLVAGKGSLGDNLLSAFMEQIVAGWAPEVVRPGLVCLCILAQQRSAKQLPGKVTKSLIKVPNLTQMLHELQPDYRVDKLANGLGLALVDRLEKKGDVRSLPIIKSLFVQNLLHEKQMKVLYKALLVAAHRIQDAVDQDGRIRKELGSALVNLSQLDDATGDIIRKTIEEVDFNIEELELKLGTAIRPRLAIEQSQANGDMEHDLENAPEQEDFDVALVRLSKQERSTTTCLTTGPSDIFNDLCSLFLLAASGKGDVSKFDAVPVLSRSSAHSKAFYFSFYVRVWSGPYPALARAAALEQAKSRLKESDCTGMDFQAIIPYGIAAMSDPSKKVRRAAADLMTVLGHSYLESSNEKKPSWGSMDLYEKAVAIDWLDPQSVKGLFEKMILPALEATVLHETHILAAFKSALDSSRGSETSDSDKKRQIPRTTRLSIMKFLSGQAICSPLLSVKLRLLLLLNQVSKAGTTTRTELLLPILSWWTESLTGDDATRLTATEALDEAAFDDACVNVVVANDEKGIDFLFKLVKNPQVATRGHLIQSIFAKLTALWSSMKREMQFSTAGRVLDLCQPGPESSSLPQVVPVEAAELLRSVGLTTEVLLSFLASARDANRQALEPSANKRRRISSDAVQTRGTDSQQHSPEVNAAINKTTFVLELVQESKPAGHPELLDSLFLILSDLQQLRTLVGSDLGYLQNITLSSLLAMTPSQGSDSTLSSGASVSHGDVLASCIQKSTSPAVINAALLLVASLARTAPDVVLHSVMPILTFMGSSVLRQADDYSAHVVNQTIKEVIPPLIDTFRKKRRNLVASTAELLSSFVVAYEHIPPHRKQETFILLIQNLGPEDFLFALMAMFVDKYGTTDSGLAFLGDVMGSFPVEVQLQALTKLLDLVGDLFKPKPSLSAALLGKHETDETDAQKLAQKIALRELTLVPQLLANRRLEREIAQLDGKEDDMEAARIRDLYAVLLETLLNLADTLQTNRALHGRCGDALSNLLNLLSTSEFIKSVEALLDRPNVALRQRVLRALELRVDRENIADVTSRSALLAFLPQLTAVIRESDDINYKQTAVVCVDKIAVKYGKKDPDAVAAAAETIAGDQCLGQSFHRLRIMALLCLASLVDVLQDGIVPVLPLATPKALKYLRESLEGEIQDVELHNAAFNFMTAIAQHLPYMISGAYLDQLLECANTSAVKCLEDDTKEYRLRCLRFVAELVDPKVLFAAISKNWNKAASVGPLAILEYLQLLGAALDKHTKSAVSKNISSLSTILLQAFDFRREERIKDIGRDDASSSPDLVQNAVNEVALKMIYKLNDAAFRPVFSQLLEWATSGLPKQDTLGRNLRQESVFSFLTAFFENLKSIVTSYASYVLEPAADILKQTNLRGSPDERGLWLHVLATLTKCFEHDQDGFWQAPAHFNAVAPVLVEQFVSAPLAGVDVSTNLIPAVVELAAAADSKEHHKDLNTSLLKLLRHEKAPVRLAVLKCQQALAKRLGAEWLQALPEMLPYISELQDDDDEVVERENRRWIVGIEETLGESLDSMLQ